MIKQEYKQIFSDLLQKLNREEKIWLSGYLSSAIDNESNNSASKISQQKVKKVTDKITIIYATETDNSKNIANELTKRLKEIKIKVKLKSIDQYKFAELKKEKYFILVTSTHGEGEVPEPAHTFFDELKNSDHDLSNIKYAILSLGDSNYSLFCQAGKDFDELFKKNKATEFLPILNLDLDFEDHIENWYNSIISKLSTGTFSTTSKVLETNKKRKSKYLGKIIENVILNDKGSNKEVHHIEIACDDVYYEPGDALGIKIGDNSPRLYSISSSADLHEGEVHLTVALSKYDENGKVKEGLCSSYLSKLKIDDEIEFYISKNNKFRLPENDKDIILVGPGTGIAPFRSFLAQREYDAASGKNWLFFGDQYSYSDFLYQIEWQNYLDSKLLTKMDVAFSRDQKEKIYVQDRIKENSPEIKKWIKNGAYFYICGDKDNMAKDVENSLIEIIGKESFDDIKENGRYLTDVY